MEEIWKDIKGFEKFYQVSNLGRVKGLDRIVINKLGRKIKRKGQIMKQILDIHVYPVVHLRKEGISKFFKVHRLVAIAFISNPNNLPMINHIDENPFNSNVNNLEWCDYTYNNNYGTRNLKLSISKSNPLYQYSLDGKFLRKFDRIIEISKLGFNIYGVLHCCEGYSKTSQGYIWKRNKGNINPEKHKKNSKYTSKNISVIQYNTNGELVKEWISIRECGRNGYQTSSIIKCCKGKQKYHKGYIWKYKEL